MKETRKETRNERHEWDKILVVQSFLSVKTIRNVISRFKYMKLAFRPLEFLYENRKPTPPPARSGQPASPVPPVTTPALLDGTMRFIIRFRRFAWDVGGILLLAFALMTMLALAVPKLAGGFLLDWATFWRKWLGLGSVLCGDQLPVLPGWRCCSAGRVR